MLGGYEVTAQIVDSIQIDVPQITVSATRTNANINKIALAISKIDISERQDYFQNSALDELLISQPGLFSQNSDNMAQDLRISMRGFGARSAFGIRGIKLIVDGIPETTPDGQGQIDNLNLNTIESIEILRGPASGLYGNASGGVINIKTQTSVDSHYVKLKYAMGSFATNKFNAETGVKINDSNLFLNASIFSSDGYRSHSRSRTNIFDGKWKRKINEHSYFLLSANYTDSPIAEDPGGITIEDATINPASARDRNIDFDAGESISHFKTAAHLVYNKNDFNLKSNFFYHNRVFDGRLPFETGGVIDLNRKFFGHSSHFQKLLKLGSHSNLITIGYDLQFQNDARQRFNNEVGSKSDLVLDQAEIFSNSALFLSNQLTLKDKLDLQVDLRYDFNHVGVSDGFLSDGDASSDIDFNSFNFNTGIGLLTLENYFPFLRVATSFETPTLSELSANPISGGFNGDLKPISSINFELGIKTKKTNWLHFETYLFYINSSNEILPFELADFPGRDFFRNVGKTNRRGFESYVLIKHEKKLNSSFSYTYSDFKFLDYTKDGVVLDDNNLPGIPKHMFSFHTDILLPHNFKIFISGRHNSHLFADDQNAVSIESNSRLDLKAIKVMMIKRTKLNLFFGVNNVFDTIYFDNVRLNAFGNRYYEPARPRNYYVGMQLLM